MALDVILTSSFNAGRWRLSVRGFEVLNEQSAIALRASDEVWDLILKAYRLRTPETIRQGRAAFAKGLQYLCFAFIRNPACGLRDFLALLEELNSRAGFEFAKVLVWYMAQWARLTALASPELQSFFASLHRLSRQDFRPALVQAFKLSSERLEHLVGGDAVYAHKRHLWPLTLDVSSQPEVLVKTLLVHLANIQQDPQPRAIVELACLARIATIYGDELGDTEEAIAVTGEGLRLMEQRGLQTTFAFSYSRFSDYHGRYLWKQGRCQDAIDTVENAAAVLRNTVPLSDTHVLLQQCRDWHQELQNDHSASVYSQLHNDAWNDLERNLDSVDVQLRSVKLYSGG